MFKDVGFYPMMNFGHFWPPSPLTFHNVKNHGGGAQKESQKELPGTKNKSNKENGTRHETTKKDTGGGTNNLVRVFLVRLMPV